MANKYAAVFTKASLFPTTFRSALISAGPAFRANMGRPTLYCRLFNPSQTASGANMAIKRPLCNYNGVVKELAATDMLPGLSSSYVPSEVPSGNMNGTNTVFTLANTPISGTEMVFLNGILQNRGAGNDYTISTNSITFLSAPVSTDIILVTYWK